MPFACCCHPELPDDLLLQKAVSSLSLSAGGSFRTVPPSEGAQRAQPAAALWRRATTGAAYEVAYRCLLCCYAHCLTSAVHLEMFHKATDACCRLGSAKCAAAVRGSAVQLAAQFPAGSSRSHGELRRGSKPRGAGKDSAEGEGALP